LFLFFYESICTERAVKIFILKKLFKILNNYIANEVSRSRKTAGKSPLILVSRFATDFVTFAM